MVNNLTERELKILSYLIDEDDFINGDDLSSRLGISKKTIQREIGSMNEILKDENCAIESVPSKGYRLGKDEKSKLINVLFLTKDKDQVIPTTQQSRQEWLIHKFISLSFNDEPVTLQKLCDELYISMTSLKYDLKRLKGIFEKYDLELVKRENKGLILKGEENKVRKLIVASLNSEHTNYSVKDLIGFTQKDEHQLRSTILEAIEQYGILVTDLGFTNLLIHIEIAVSRIRKNKIIQSTMKLEKDDFVSKEYACASYLCLKISQELNCEMPVFEIQNVYQHLIAQKRILNKNMQIEMDEDTAMLVNHTLEKIKQVYGFDFSKDSTLRFGLVAHLDSALNRLKLKMRIQNDLLQEIKTNYPFAFELANILGKDIEEAYGVSVNEDEIGFLAIHFCGALERLNSSKETSVKALIVCSTGIGTSLLLKSKINAKFKDKIEILDVCAMYQIKTYPEDEYDLIISTIPLEAKKDSIVVTPLLNEDDIEQINRYLKYGNDQFKPIKNLFVSELFFPDIDLDNRENIIEFMSDQLLEKGYIDQECKESYKKRENMATTEIGNLVSVPHSMDGKIYKSAICVGILNKPIQWEYGMVQIVLMIAVRKEDIHKENEFFLHVYQKFDPLYKAKKSISMKNIEYIRQQFTEEEFI